MFKSIQDNISFFLGAVTLTDYFTSWLAVFDLQTIVLVLTAIWLATQIFIKIWEFIQNYKANKNVERP